MPSESVDGGQRFCLFHEAHDQPSRGLILYVHPFAEEMNKSRRMAALRSSEDRPSSPGYPFEPLSPLAFELELCHGLHTP